MVVIISDVVPLLGDCDISVCYPRWCWNMCILSTGTIYLMFFAYFCYSYVAGLNNGGPKIVPCDSHMGNVEL